MEESEDSMSSDDVKYSINPAYFKVLPKKRSIIERELETTLTSRITSPVRSSDGSSTSRYGRARRLIIDSESTDSEKHIFKRLKSPKREKVPVTPVQSPVYKMHASNSPIRIESPKKYIESNLENHIEKIYSENISLSRFGSTEKLISPSKRRPKVYIRKDLIQIKDKDKDTDETITLIKNIFSPVKSTQKSSVNAPHQRSSGKHKRRKTANGYLDTSSVVKTLDFDETKKKNEEIIDDKTFVKKEFIELEATCKFQLADLAWARMGTYPFWPCIVTREPSSELFVKTKWFGRVEHCVIHVTFFGDNGRRSWILDSMLRKFLGLLEFEVARSQFTPEMRKKDPKLYMAYFISDRKMPQWNISVEEAETLLREPKNLRMDLLNKILQQVKIEKGTPETSRSKKIVRTDSDVSLSETLFDTLFSEDDKKDLDQSRSKSKNKALDVSDVVTACLDNMAAKTGITKIQRQSHMDRWLQKAKCKTPEKSLLKNQHVPTLTKSSKTKKKLPVILPSLQPYISKKSHESRKNELSRIKRHTRSCTLTKPNKQYLRNDIDLYDSDVSKSSSLQESEIRINSKEEKLHRQAEFNNTNDKNPTIIDDHETDIKNIITYLGNSIRTDAIYEGSNISNDVDKQCNNSLHNTIHFGEHKIAKNSTLSEREHKVFLSSTDLISDHSENIFIKHEVSDNYDDTGSSENQSKSSDFCTEVLPIQNQSSSILLEVVEPSRSPDKRIIKSKNNNKLKRGLDVSYQGVIQISGTDAKKKSRIQELKENKNQEDYEKSFKGFPETVKMEFDYDTYCLQELAQITDESQVDKLNITNTANECTKNSSNVENDASCVLFSSESEIKPTESNCDSHNRIRNDQNNQGQLISQETSIIENKSLVINESVSSLPKIINSNETNNRNKSVNHDDQSLSNNYVSVKFNDSLSFVTGVVDENQPNFHKSFVLKETAGVSSNLTDVSTNTEFEPETESIKLNEPSIVTLDKNQLNFQEHIALKDIHPESSELTSTENSNESICGNVIIAENKSISHSLVNIEKPFQASSIFLEVKESPGTNDIIIKNQLSKQEVIHNQESNVIKTRNVKINKDKLIKNVFEDNGRNNVLKLSDKTKKSDTMCNNIEAPVEIYECINNVNRDKVINQRQILKKETATINEKKTLNEKSYSLSIKCYGNIRKDGNKGDFITEDSKKLKNKKNNDFIFENETLYDEVIFTKEKSNKIQLLQEKHDEKKEKILDSHSINNVISENQDKDNLMPLNNFVEPAIKKETGKFKLSLNRNIVSQNIEEQKNSTTHKLPNSVNTTNLFNQILFDHTIARLFDKKIEKGTNSNINKTAVFINSLEARKSINNEGSELFQTTSNENVIFDTKIVEEITRNNQGEDCNTVVDKIVNKNILADQDIFDHSLVTGDVKEQIKKNILTGCDMSNDKSIKICNRNKLQQSFNLENVVNERSSGDPKFSNEGNVLENISVSNEESVLQNITEHCIKGNHVTESITTNRIENTILTSDQSAVASNKTKENVEVDKISPKFNLSLSKKCSNDNAIKVLDEKHLIKRDATNRLTKDRLNIESSTISNRIVVNGFHIEEELCLDEYSPDKIFEETNLQLEQDSIAVLGVDDGNNSALANNVKETQIEADCVPEDSDVSLSRRKLLCKIGPLQNFKKEGMEDPKFLKYVDLRQDALADENPELTEEDLINYLYKSWLYEENAKNDKKLAEDFEEITFVKDTARSPSPVKKVRKKIVKIEKRIDTEKKITEETEGSIKEKSKRTITQVRPFYTEDYSDIEDELELYEIFNSKKKEPKAEYSEKGGSKLPDSKFDEIHEEIEEISEEKVDQVEIYFQQLTAPKPNLFKGLIREKVCELCEKVGNLIKCKTCHGMFHLECNKAQDEAFESPQPNKGRKKKKKTRVRKRKIFGESSTFDSESQSDEKSFSVNISDDMLNISVEIDMENNKVVDAERFEVFASAKMKEILDNVESVGYDSDISDDGLNWSDVEVGKCEIVDITLRKKGCTVPEEFKCKNCQKYEIPVCFVCKSATSPEEKVEHRQRCQVAHCNQYYHLECLYHWPQTQFNSGERSKNNKRAEYFEAMSCPRHVCHTCVCDDPRGCKTRFSGDKLARCVRCPATYHSFTKCLPAGSQVLTGSFIICPRHYKHRPGKVPCHVNTGWCFICALGGILICCEYCPTSFHAECLNIDPPEGGYMCEDCETGRLPLYGEMVWVKLGHYRWWPGLILHPSEIPRNVLAVKHSPGEFVVRFFGQYDYYWVNRGRVFPFQEGDSGKVSSQRSKIDAAFTMAVEHAKRACEILTKASMNQEESQDIVSSLLPPHYVKLKVNKPVGSLTSRRPDLEESSLTQCECDPNDIEPCGPYSQCLNRMLLTECGPTCRAGEKCNNRAFEKRLYPKMEPYRTPHRGWGLKALEEVRAGQFVIEYVGELISEEEFQRRMRRKHEVRDENFYFLTLDKERMIDAGPKGNLARFMNHSCEPNCETQKWTVLGDVRVGLFALYDIPANSELTFNYNLESAGIEKKRCMCGAKRCSGYIGAKPKQNDPQPKKKKLGVKKTSKKRKTIELSPTISKIKPKQRLGRPVKPRELTEIEKDLLIIKNATNISSDSECSRISIESKDSRGFKRKHTRRSSEDLSLPSTSGKRSKTDVLD